MGTAPQHTAQAGELLRHLDRAAMRYRLILASGMAYRLADEIVCETCQEWEHSFPAMPCISVTKEPGPNR